MWSGGSAAWGKTGPIVEIYYADRSIGRNYAIAAIDFHIQHVGRVLAYLLQAFLIELDALALAVDSLKAIFAVAFIVGVEPIEESRSGNAIELDQVADEMFVDHRALDATQEIFLNPAF